MTPTELEQGLKTLKRRMILVTYVWLGAITLFLFAAAAADRPLIGGGVFIAGLFGMLLFLHLSLHGWARQLGLLCPHCERFVVKSNRWETVLVTRRCEHCGKDLW